MKANQALIDRYSQEIIALTAAAATIRRIEAGEPDGTVGEPRTDFEEEIARTIENRCPEPIAVEYLDGNTAVYTRWLRRKADTFTDAAKERERLLKVYGAEPPTHPDAWSDETAHAGFNLGLKLGFFGDHDELK